ncbi:hypothetical protein GCM10027598_71560 [Amycolatopsis oliviviridis]|uniref:Recombinase zinc beta ribbon domain-containing protein n=1 Tax=Amycolatopsis oliviviridis TaxID=1471590 RepID=A0ABQ3L7A1_9PSEU|nr:zinc ribbon domain-containing protein [Amycolatopsis oliviviridis]GHH01488.1 hypothetical protein GCM10017790_01490 [Amycolatopsis oliviviridis]
MKHVYLFRGLIGCGACERKMEGGPRKYRMYYRCPARTLAPGAPALLAHPPTIYLRKEPLRDVANGWIGGLFDQQKIEQTVSQLVGAQPAVRAEGDGVASKQLEEVEAKLRRFQDAIAAGVDPTALVESINEA